tara:strand:- start:34 stop:549 length:516 start_codon:yes stop_codon:yes gene_type:complete
MNRHTTIILTLLVACLVSPAFAKSAGKISIGARQHVEHSAFNELPFVDDDISYGLAYEGRDQNAIWQLAVTYTPELDGSELLDYALTPQLNLLAIDRQWRTGLGILQTYVETDTDSEWTDLYWQFLFGINLGDPSSFDLQIMANYVFESWSDISDFEGNDIEFSVWLSFAL